MCNLVKYEYAIELVIILKVVVLRVTTAANKLIKWLQVGGQTKVA